MDWWKRNPLDSKTETGMSLEDRYYRQLHEFAKHIQLCNKCNKGGKREFCEEGDEKDLFEDLVSIVTSFCARLYGKRRGGQKAKKIRENLIDD